MLKKMQAFFSLLVLVGITIPVYGTNHYVNANVSTSGDGTSYSTAWQTFSDINWATVQSGDTIFIAQGTYTTLLNVQRAGVVIMKSPHTGYNGKVTIDGTNIVTPNNCCVYVGVENVVIDGGDPSKFILEYGQATNLSVHEATNFTFKNATLYTTPTINPQQTADIYVQRQSPTMVHGDMLFENLRVIQDSGSYSGSGNSDGFQIQGIDGLTIKNCYIVRQNADNTPHCDGIQMFWCSNVTLENNQIYILPSGATTNKTALMFNNSGGVVKFINNYIYWAQALGAGGSLGMQFSDAARMAAYPLDSLIIVNNTSVCLGGTPIGISNDLALNYRGRAIVKNNILVGINARYDTLLLDYAHKTNITNNIYYNPAGGNMQISQGQNGYGTWGQTWQTWTANGYDVNSYQTNPELTGYIPASSSVIDGGVNLTGLGYTDDIAGNTRLGTWDIGAYEITQGGGGGNNPPTQPANPGPSNGAINQLTNTTLTWSCSDPNGDPLTYDVYFGTANNPPLVAGNQTSASYNPGQLNNSTTYYWKIVAKDNQGATTAGPVWNFSTSSQIDTISPGLKEVSLSGTKTVIVTFSEEMDPATIENKDNYSINNDITVVSVDVLAGNKRVILNTTDHTLGLLYTLTANNVKDISGNLIAQDKKTLIYRAIIKKKYSVIQADGQWYQNYTPQKAIDGNTDTSSASRWGGILPLPDSIVFDLGGVNTIDETHFSFYRWNQGRIYNYSLMTSRDGTHWMQAVNNNSSTEMEWTIDEFSPVEARYIKLVVLSSNESQFAGLWEAEILGPDNLTGIENANEIPSEFKLEQNYPNPFNPTTTINFNLPSDQQVKINVYNTIGQLVISLVNQFYTSGSHSVIFNASDLPSGVYIYRLESKSFNDSKKMILMK